MLSLQKILYQLKILYFGKQDEILESELFYHDVPNHESVDKDVRIYLATSNYRVILIIGGVHEKKGAFLYF